MTKGDCAMLLTVTLALFYRPREGLHNAHEVALGKGKKQQLLAVVNEAQPVSHPAIMNFRDMREDIRSELER